MSRISVRLSSRRSPSRPRAMHAERRMNGCRPAFVYSRITGIAFGSRRSARARSPLRVMIPAWEGRSSPFTIVSNAFGCRDDPMPRAAEPAA